MAAKVGKPRTLPKQSLEMVYYCDKCGIELNGTFHALAHSTWDGNGFAIMKVADHPSVSMCDDCYNKLDLQQQFRKI